MAGDGGVFSFGDATFYGSMGATHLAAGVTGMAGTKDGKGYWMVAGDGGVFAFGDATFYGSLGQKPPPDSIAGMATTPDHAGYWMVGNDGSVYPFGDAQSFGSTRHDQAHLPRRRHRPDDRRPGLLAVGARRLVLFVLGPVALRAGGLRRRSRHSPPARSAPTPTARSGPYCNPYGPCEQWCALFVTWVWAHAGVPIPSIPFTGNIYAWAAAHGRILPFNVLPAPGDAVLFGTGPGSTATSVHTGLVVEVWPDDAVVTVEGDAGPAPSGQLATIINGPFLIGDSQVLQRRSRLRRRPAGALTRVQPLVFAIAAGGPGT